MDINFETSDSQVVSVPADIINFSETIKNMISCVSEDDVACNNIPLPNVSSVTLSFVVRYCSMLKDNDVRDTIFADIKKELLFDVIIAANYLDIKPLLDHSCKMVAELLKGKTPVQIRHEFNIKNDFTPEEEEAIRKENEWCTSING